MSYNCNYTVSITNGDNNNDPKETELKQKSSECKELQIELDVLKQKQMQKMNNH